MPHSRLPCMRAIDLAKATRTSVHTIRYYEKLGLLEARRNPANGYREFGDEHVKLLSCIRCLRGAGMSLTEVRLLIGAMNHPSRTCPETLPIVARVAAAIESDLEQLEIVSRGLRAFGFQRPRTSLPPTGADVRRLVEVIASTKRSPAKSP